MREWRQTIQDERYEVSSLGEIRMIGKDYCLKPNWDATGGYGRVSLKKQVRVHTVVAYAFLGPRPDGLDINHIDGNKRNNSSLNLEYVTRSENCRQACGIQGLRNMKGENHSRSKLTNKNLIEIRAMLDNKVKNMTIASIFNVDASLISHIKRGKRWH